MTFEDDDMFAMSLEHLISQGVFLLNSSLTVKKDEPNSHEGYWDGFIEATIRLIGTYSKNVIWILLGAKAKRWHEHINSLNDSPYMPGTHRIFSDNHPSYYARQESQMSARVFKGTNELLEERNEKPIEWIS